MRRDWSRYWDEVAPSYDSLYQSPWSAVEDVTVANWLQEAIRGSDFCTVLDIGCGTGLGYDLLRRFKHRFVYTGVDSSAEMLRVFEQKRASLPGTNFSLFCASAAEIPALLPQQSFDVVLMLNGVGSYLDYPTTGFRLTQNMLRLGGRAFLSYYNRYALRLAPWHRPAGEHYFGTRGGSRLTEPRIWPLSLPQVERRARRFGLLLKNIAYQSVLGGVWETKNSIGVETILINAVPSLGHTINVTLERT